MPNHADLHMHNGVIWGFQKIGGPEYSTLNSRILIIRTPKIRYP